MTRPSIILSDDQVLTILKQLAPIIDGPPAGARDHREAVKFFIRAVYDATGRTFSPNIYRKWLKAYLPYCKPSTATLEKEKMAFIEGIEHDLHTSAPSPQMPGDAGLAGHLRRVIKEEMANRPVRPIHDLVLENVALSQRDFMQSLLTDKERELKDIRAHAARLAAELQSTIKENAVLANDVQATRAIAVTQAEQLAKLITEFEGMRRFALNAVDQVRGETRSWQERCAAQQLQIDDMKKQMEYYRQAAYSRGATVHPDLRG